MYAVHLSYGNTILCKSIKASTIEQYLIAVSSLIKGFTEEDFRKDDSSDRNLGSLLSGVLKDIKRYENMADRREPYDHKMHAMARRAASKFPHTSVVCTLVDGFEQGMCAGYRLTEWAQPAGRTCVSRPHLNGRSAPECRTRAIVPVDVRAVSVDGQRLVGLAIIMLSLCNVLKMYIKFRTQKNGNHGEEKLFERNPTPGGFCFVSSTYRSLVRFAQIQLMYPGISPSVTPLSIYWDPKGKVPKLVDATSIEKFMRRLASTVYNLHPVHDSKDIAKWSSHSLRVGACVVLHVMGFSDRDIQWILRWKSMTFITYFRNVALLSRRQNAAFDRLQALPWL
ncbi:unknown protein [Seminavis robusta]|uniref:Uncharacterized protein n=1 Tax=Seminavis robusta TaxID=568900 RepID=A0A9N8HYU5_9STRA|nr:unknown protein [Seminavis robusta]|eukprot:Sro3060_g342970.1 n/a (338) ;mRNA; r:2547-3560